jgi:hypothetical protein
LTKNPADRMGHTLDGTEIRHHPFFMSLDFEAVLQRKMTAPIIVKIKDPLDLSYFDDAFTQQDISDNPLGRQEENFAKYDDEFDNFYFNPEGGNEAKQVV